MPTDTPPPDDDSRTFGQQIIDSLREGIADAKAGKPFRQTVVRRMTVKGETVYAHETFTAPLGRPKGR